MTEIINKLQKESRIKYLLKDSKSTTKQLYGKKDLSGFIKLPALFKDQEYNQLEEKLQ